MNYKKILAMGLVVSTITMTSHINLYASYDANAAVAYANQYAEKPNNWDYRYFPDVDCTNFVSQCAKAGGAIMRNQPSNCYLKRSVIKDDEAWFHLFDGYHYLITQSWTVVDEFYKYWKTHSGATYSANCTIDQLKLIVRKGDIIQCARGSKFSHSVIWEDGVGGDGLLLQGGDEVDADTVMLELPVLDAGEVDALRQPGPVQVLIHLLSPCHRWIFCPIGGVAHDPFYYTQL